MIDDNSKLHLSIVDLGDALAIIEQLGMDCRSRGCAFAPDKRGVRVQGGCRHGERLHSWTSRRKRTPHE